MSARERLERYEVIAAYISHRSLVVIVPEGEDPMIPANWTELLDEHEIEFYLDEVSDVALLEVIHAGSRDRP